jgi:hypothetical protein
MGGDADAACDARRSDPVAKNKAPVTGAQSRRLDRASGHWRPADADTAIVAAMLRALKRREVE